MQHTRRVAYEGIAWMNSVECRAATVAVSPQYNRLEGLISESAKSRVLHC